MSLISQHWGGAIIGLWRNETYTSGHAPIYLSGFMLNRSANSNTATEIGLMKDDFDSRALGSLLNDRVQQLSTYMIVFGVLWGTAGTFLALKRDLSVAIFPYAIMGTIFVLSAIHRNRLAARNFVINVFLLTNAIGLLICSALGQFTESTIEFHFAIISLMAVQLLGMRAALRWFAFTIAAIIFSLYSPFVSPLQISLGNTLDHAVSASILSLTILWICEQTERCFVRRTAQLQRLADSLKEKTRLLNLAEETASIGYWHWNLNTNTTVFSDELKRICKLKHLNHIDELIGRFESSGAEELKAVLRQAADKGTSFSLDLSFQDDNIERHMACQGFSELGANGNVEAVFGVVRDETKLKVATQRLSKKAEELKVLANVDTLTGLSNRLSFRMHLEAMTQDSLLHDGKLALIVLDMDGFKEINDTLGHSVGDLVLIETAKRIQSVVGDQDIVSRLGGDEFTVILHRPESTDYVVDMSHRIVEAIREPMHFENSKLQVGASIGASIYPNDSRSSEELFTFADTAMYNAKFSSKDVSLYRSAMTEDLVHRKQVESKLSEAMSRDEFSLVYQPQFETRTRKVVGFEALIRWNQNGNVVSPAEFIPVLESSGRIIETGQWILDQACRQLKEWELTGISTRVAINISPVQFRDPNFYSRVVETLERHDVAPECIDLEITEGAIISDVTHTAETLTKLKAFGCMISIDDFGTGYSSLAYLKNFPIDQLKIDRAFVSDIPHRDDGTIASSIVVLGLSLGMEVLAEGVESKEQLDFLLSHDCEYFQGFYGGKPLPPNECVMLFANQDVHEDSAFENAGH